MKVTYSLVGMPHQGTVDIVAALKEGDALMLVREPSNRFDANAVAVWAGDRRVAYIPSKTNKFLSNLIDQKGTPFTPPEGSPTMAMDGAPANGNCMPAIFKRSPNHAYPQALVDEGE